MAFCKNRYLAYNQLPFRADAEPVYQSHFHQSTRRTIRPSQVGAEVVGI